MIDLILPAIALAVLIFVLIHTIRTNKRIEKMYDKTKDD